MKVTRGMQRRTAKLARRSTVVNAQTLVAGVDIAKRESWVVFVPTADKARVGRLKVPSAAGGILQLAAQTRRLREQHGLERVDLAMGPAGNEGLVCGGSSSAATLCAISTTSSARPPATANRSGSALSG
ncbi:MAG TPA: hypothetical protein VMV09_06525, partial [Candidatus Saccharimonadales bacterium]|nr:hypothetical protein [Candidatus Saccharimonadales bacterium]